MDLRGSVVLVTGGSSGIGLATAAALARGGAQAVIVGRDEARLQQAVCGLPGEARTNIHPQSLDVRDEVAVSTVVAEVLRRFGTIGGLVNAAGTVRTRQPVPDTSTHDWRLIWETNVTGTYLMCRAVVPAMVRAGTGEIVNVGSRSSYRSQAGNSLYAASKYGVRALTEALAEENQRTGVRVASVNPGPTDTNIWDYKIAPPSAEERSLMLRPEEVAGVVVWLLTLPPGIQVRSVIVSPRLDRGSRRTVSGSLDVNPSSWSQEPRP